MKLLKSMRRCLQYVRIPVGPTVVAARCKSKANAAVSVTKIGTKNPGKNSIETTEKTAAGTGQKGLLWKKRIVQI